jgi:hypothetical protein
MALAASFRPPSDYRRERLDFPSRYRGAVPHHLEPVPPDGSPFDPPDELGAADDLQPMARPTWWRWVAIAVILAMVVAGPVAFVIYRLLT